MMLLQFVLYYFHFNRISGKFLKGGIPDTSTAAKSLINDWNSGKIKYFSEPPKSEKVHLSSSIITESTDYLKNLLDEFENDSKPFENGEFLRSYYFKE